MRLRIAITAILVLWTSLMVVHSANVANVTGGEGKPGDRVEIAVELVTDATDAVAAEIRVPLPDGVKPVEGSFVPTSDRVPKHTVTADFNGNEYVIVVFNTSLSPIPTGNGELAHFTVELGENPGVYNVTPKVKLSGADGSALTATASGGTLSVLAPRIELGEDEVDFGRVPIRSSVRRNVTVRNTGTTDLAIDQFSTNIEGLSANLPSTLGAGESGVMELVYSPTQRSKGVSGRITPQSNSVGKAPFIAIKSVPFSVNELHVGNASGICNEQVEMSVRMNNMEPITGVEFTIQLPEELDFVEGSLKKSSRADALSAESYVDGNKRVRIVLFGLAQKPISGEDGELVKFNLLLRGRTGGYRLNPDKVILANAGGENMTSATSGGSVSISSPAIFCNSEMALGNLPLSGTNQFSHNISNNGIAPLTISKVTFLNDIAECASQLPMVIQPNQTSSLNIAIKEPKFGEFATTMNIYSNDPDNELKTVNVSGNFYSANELSFAGKFEDGKFFVETSLSNEAQIAALQIDVVCPDEVITDESLLTLSERASQHNATIAKVGNNRYRIVIFSLKNIPFTGNDGVLFSLGLEGDDIAGKQIRVENIKLSSVDGVNFTTPDSDVKFGNMPVPVREITLSPVSASLKVSEKMQIKATINPQNASNRAVKWSSSDDAIAAVDESGLVTAHALGSAIITASAVDGSGVKSECEITVVPTPAESISLDKTEVSLKATESVTLSATIAPETTTDKTVTWSSSDENVATVDGNGKVTAVAVGETTVTATAASGVKTECKVTVIRTPAESIALDKTEVTLRNCLNLIQ